MTRTPTPDLSALTAVSLGGDRYQVSGHAAPHVVTWGEPPTCDCPDFRYRRDAARDACKHIRAVEAFRTADPQAALLDPMAPEDALELLGPSWEDVKDRAERPRAYLIDPYDRRLAIGALEAWGEELRTKKRTSTTFDALWSAACLAVEGLEQEHTAPGSAAQAFADAAAIVASQAVA